jgi:hypothetical protein
MTPPQPTVADQLIQSVKQPLPEPGQQAMPQGMPQQGMPQGAPQMQGLPQGLPQGMAPSMAPAPQPGLQQLPSNIGQHMSGGGIVAFARGDDVEMPPSEEATSTAGNLFKEIKDFFKRQQAQSLETQQRNREGNELRREISQTNPGFFEQLTPTERAEREAQLAELTGQIKNVRNAPVAASIETPDYSGRPTRRSDYETAPIRNLPPSAANLNPPRPRPSASQNVPAGPQDNPLRDYVSSLSAPAAAAAPPTMEQQINKFYENSFKVTPEEAEAKRRKEHAEQVGGVDTSQYDRLMAEYESRKKQLEGPKPGIDSLMEYLGMVAATPRGRSWTEAGSSAARAQNALQQDRQAQQFELTKLGLEAAQKKSDILRNEKKDIFSMAKAAYDERYKQNFELAKDYTKTEFERKKWAEQLTNYEMDRQNNLLMEREREKGAAARHTVPVENQVYAGYLRANNNDPQKAYEAMKAAAVVGKGVMTRDQAADNVRKDLENIQTGGKLIADAKVTLQSMGIPQPTMQQVQEYLIQQNMKGVSLAPPPQPNTALFSKADAILSGSK